MAQRAAEAQQRGDRTGLVDPANIVPPDAVGNNATHEIKAGEQTLDIKLTKPGT